MKYHAALQAVLVAVLLYPVFSHAQGGTDVKAVKKVVRDVLKGGLSVCVNQTDDTVKARLACRKTETEVTKTMLERSILDTSKTRFIFSDEKIDSGVQFFPENPTLVQIRMTCRDGEAYVPDTLTIPEINGVRLSNIFRYKKYPDGTIGGGVINEIVVQFASLTETPISESFNPALSMACQTL